MIVQRNNPNLNKIIERFDADVAMFNDFKRVLVYFPPPPLLPRFPFSF